MTEPSDEGSAPEANIAENPERSLIQNRLLGIFERLLRHAPIGPDDDFFDLGGDSLVSIELMVEIAATFGCDLPMTAIYDAPTARSLVALIAEQSRPEASCLILLKPGTATAPLFIAHGLGGSVMELRQVANGIDTDRAVYGIEARGLDGVAEPLDSIEDMADVYIQAMRQIQPAGPYHLAGFSFGGLVAFEMAQQLLRAHEDVAFLALLDSFPHTRYWPVRARIASWRRLAGFSGSGTTLYRLLKYHREVLRTKSLADAVPYLASRSLRAVKIFSDIFRLGAWLQRFADFPAPPGPGTVAQTIAIPPTVLRVQRAGEMAYRKYRPSFYHNEITFIKAQEEMRIPFDAKVLWSRLASKVTVRTIPGDHQNLVRASADSLAAQLTADLRRLEKQPALAAP
jgi:acetoacetyl-CoA synthetase